MMAIGVCSSLAVSTFSLVYGQDARIRPVVALAIAVSLSTMSTIASLVDYTMKGVPLVLREHQVYFESANHAFAVLSSLTYLVVLSIDISYITQYGNAYPHGPDDMHGDDLQRRIAAWGIADIAAAMASCINLAALVWIYDRAVRLQRKMGSTE